MVRQDTVFTQLKGNLKSKIFVFEYSLTIQKGLILFGLYSLDNSPNTLHKSRKDYKILWVSYRGFEYYKPKMNEEHNPQKQISIMDKKNFWIERAHLTQFH